MLDTATELLLYKLYVEPLISTVLNYNPLYCIDYKKYSLSLIFKSGVVYPSTEAVVPKLFPLNGGTEISKYLLLFPSPPQDKNVLLYGLFISRLPFCKFNLVPFAFLLV